MSFDTSRFAFNPWHDFLGVVMQQGRVQLDADWNDLVSQMVRRLQAGSLDTYGAAVVPRTTPDGFRIDAVGGTLKIGVGRMYVDGLLAENHGTGTADWRRDLAELVGSDALDYTAQPYYPEAPELPAGGPHLVYLDVWRREVTALQHPELVEKAVGVDTTGRWQTVWQVKVLPRVSGAQCSTPDGEVLGWSAATRPSDGRLTTGTAAVIDEPDPCILPPSGGYRGRENQLYRVEIHDPGAVGQATFKWSRDNATVQTGVAQINSARDRLVVDLVGRDDVLRFSDGDWVEILDDVIELHGRPGIVRRIALGGGVDDATRTIRLTEPLPADVFPTGAQDRTEPERHTRIRRWDQSGRILRPDGSVFHDLDATASSGVIPVPPSGTQVFLEYGIVVSFDLAGAGGTFHAGDHWAFAARTADASVEVLTTAPPRGPHHHFARLAIVSFPEGESDCRVLWPPEGGGGDDCSCDACVTVKGHASGAATIQQAIDKLAPTGGVICLEAGTYRLREPLRFENARGVTLRGKGWRTQLVPHAAGTAVRIEASRSVALEHLAVIGAANGTEAQALVTARNTLGLVLDDVYLVAIPTGEGSSLGLELAGYALGVRVSQSVFVCDVGLIGGFRKDQALLTGQLSIADSLFVCSQSAMFLGRRAVHYGDTVIARNLVVATRLAGLIVQGGALPLSSFRIDANTLSGTGNGIMAGVGGLRITDNQIHGATGRERGDGISLLEGPNPTGLGEVWITGNRIGNLAGDAIEIRAAADSVLIKQNIVTDVRSGLGFSDTGSVRHLSIENNQFRRLGAGVNPAGASVVGLQVTASQDVSVVGNSIEGCAQDALQASDRAAIRISHCGDVRVSGNHLTEIGPRQAHAGVVAGVELQMPYTRATIESNTIVRSAAVDLAASAWQGIRVALPGERPIFTTVGAVLLQADQMYLLTRTRIRALPLAQPECLAVRGNHVQARGAFGSVVAIAGMLQAIVTDNHIQGTPIRGAAAGTLMEIGALGAIVSNNRAHWIGADQDAINIVGAKAFTVVGNITMGNIRIGGGVLPEPWTRLNVLL